MQLLRTLWREEDGQDLIEYTLLVAFIVFVTAGFVGIGTESIKGIVEHQQLADRRRQQHHPPLSRPH